jgi:hypothetical protein
VSSRQFPSAAAILLLITWGMPIGAIAALAIRGAGNLVQISWPTNRWLVTLQSRTNLDTGTWQVFTRAPVLSNGSNLVITTNAPEPRFFRLAY